MVWLLIALILFIVPFVIDDGYGGFIFCSICIFGFITMYGFFVYPNTIGEQKQIQVLESKVEDVREAYYKETSSLNPSPLINGSLTNAQQSTILSEYIKKIAELKADYASSVLKLQYYRSRLLYKLFWIGWFIPKEINNLKI